MRVTLQRNPENQNIWRFHAAAVQRPLVEFNVTAYHRRLDGHINVKGHWLHDVDLLIWCTLLKFDSLSHPVFAKLKD